MKRISTAAVIAFAAVALASCAGAPMQTAALDVSTQPQDVSCRELLVVASNQLQRVCGTDEQWGRYERRLAAISQAFILQLQGSAYSGY
jgi:hypothetical protein